MVDIRECARLVITHGGGLEVTARDLVLEFLLQQVQPADE